jgi:hypothetical protein
MDLVVRFLVGGAIVSIFALAADVLKPKGSVPGKTWALSVLASQSPTGASASNRYAAAGVRPKLTSTAHIF